MIFQKLSLMCARPAAVGVMALLFVTAAFEPCSGEVYRYIDEQGNIHITDDLSAVPKEQRAQRERATGEQRDRIQPVKQAATSTDTVSKGPTLSARAAPRPDPAMPKNATAQIGKKLDSMDSADRSGTPKLPLEHEDQFKDVKAASSIPPVSASCVELKKGLNEDFDKIMQAIRVLAEKKKKGTLGVLDYGKGMWTLKSVAWVVFRIKTGPEQCVNEYLKENEQRFEAQSKEIDMLTKETQDK